MLRRLLLCLLLLAAPARADRAAQRLLEIEPIAVPRGLGTPEVERAVLASAAQREWTIVSRSAGEMMLCYAPRDLSAIVRIAYDSHSVHLAYAGSVNMDYTESGGVRYIHPNYNRWVQHLAIDILHDMLRMQSEQERSAN